MRPKLIINADDFGLTHGINRAVIQAHCCGVLTSATLMAGGLAWAEAVELARAYPGLGVGVHLTLTALEPVLPPEQIPSLVDRRGRFRRQFWRAPLWRPDEVRAEWRAQIGRVVEAGIVPTHLDSHHHVHLWPPLAAIACELAGEFGIGAVRLLDGDSLNRMGAAAWQRWLVGRPRALPSRRPATVAALEAIGLNRKELGAYLAALGPGVHELFCHPGSVGDVQLAAISSLTAQRSKETAVLCSRWFKELLEQVELTSYKIFAEEGM